MIIWKINEKCLSLQRQNNSFDYAAECGEQDLIDTTPFNSHLRVAFFKTYSYSIIKGYLCNENIKNDNEWRSS